MAAVKAKPAAGRRLDRSRPFGQVFGASNGAAYEQDCVLFDAGGLEIGSPALASVDGCDDDFPDPPEAK